MRFPLRSLLFSLALILSARPVLAQPIQWGEIIMLSSGQHQLSAQGSERVTFTTNKLEWEEWQLDTGGLLSYHGSRMVNERGTIAHAWSHVSDPSRVRLQAVKWTGQQYSIAELVDGGEVLLWNSHQYFVPNGQAIVGYMNLWQVPNGLAFRVRRVGAPKPGRRPELQALTDHAVTGIRSTHGTYAGAMNPVANTTAAATHGPSNTPALRWNVLISKQFAANSGERFLRAGDVVSVVVDLGSGTMLSMKPAGRTGSFAGWELVDFVPGIQPYWTILADGYATGQRLPIRAVVYLRGPGGTHLSAVPGVPPLALSGNRASWERWTLTMP